MKVVSSAGDITILKYVCTGFILDEKKVLQKALALEMSISTNKVK